MTSGGLNGVTVLVTRPDAQAGELMAAIKNAGGNAIAFPVLDIESLAHTEITAAAEQLTEPDIAVFVSSNAVEHGIGFAGRARLAAIGPATAAALQAAGRAVDIVPADGFDSESLLEEPALQDLKGKTIRIIRATSGRDFLGQRLLERGARVDYLATYRRVRVSPDPKLLENVAAACRDGEIGVVTVMSIATLDSLLQLLPDWCTSRLGNTLLVTPAARVIKDILERFPAAQPVLASRPDATAMVRAMVQAIAETKVDSTRAR